MGSPFGPGIDEEFSYELSGQLYGAQLAINNVSTNGFLIGAEAGYSLANISGSPFEGDGPVGISASFDMISTAQVRVGYANEKYAVYLKGGLAAGHSNFELFLWDYETNHFGTVFGAGADMMISDSVSVGVSYDMITFDQTENMSDFIYIEGPDDLVGVGSILDASVQLITARIDYHF